MAQLGFAIYYNPRARVRHIVMPERLTWTQIANTAKAAGSNWGYYETELWKRPVSLRGDFALWLGAWSRVLRRQRSHVAYSQALFYSAKIRRKLSYIAPRGFTDH
ncbi:MAG: hypothetical protein JO022_11115, partial [Acidobacteriaceae bacterium]|nr:hypothetical protein [Acidobacteriaceae bacterium]